MLHPDGVLAPLVCIAGLAAASGRLLYRRSALGDNYASRSSGSKPSPTP